MDAQELRNLQEAYMEVVMNELDEGYKELPVDKMVAKSKSLSRKPKPPGSPRWGPSDEAASRIRKVAGTHSRAKVKKVEKANRERGTQQEQVDLYDIILSHLLDEGYAETPEAAEAIMVNMSEEWREDIMEISDRKVKAVRDAREKQWNKQYGKNRVKDPTDDMVDKVDKLIDQRNKRTGSKVKKTTLGQLTDKIAARRRGEA